MKRTLHLTVTMLLVMIASVNGAYGQEQVHVVNSVAEAKQLNDGDSVCLVVDGALCPDHYEGWYIYLQKLSHYQRNRPH